MFKWLKERRAQKREERLADLQHNIKLQKAFLIDQEIAGLILGTVMYGEPLPEIQEEPETLSKEDDPDYDKIQLGRDFLLSAEMTMRKALWPVSDNLDMIDYNPTAVARERVLRDVYEAHATGRDKSVKDVIELYLHFMPDDQAEKYKAAMAISCHPSRI